MLRSRLFSPRPRRGVTLMEIVVAAVVLAVIAGVVSLNVSTSSRVGGESQRLDEVAKTLARLADAASRYSNVATDISARSFSQIMLSGTTNPLTLSELTNKVGGADRNSCNGTFLSPNNWKGPFYNRMIPTSGLQIAEGFHANNRLERFDPAGAPSALVSPNTTTPGTLAIVIPNVSRSDALGLRTRVEGTSTATTGPVRFPDTGDPVTVYYHFNIHGC